MAEGSTLPYFTRLRILARQAGYFYERLAKLPGELDDCPIICRGPYANPQAGCPDCEYTALLNNFRKNYYASLRRHVERKLRQSDTGNTLPPELVAEIVTEEAERPPSFDELLADFGRLLSIEEEAGTDTAEEAGGHNPLWTVRTAEAIRVIREERRKVRKEMRRTREAEFKAFLDGLKNG